MPIDVDKSAAAALLQSVLSECENTPVNDCLIAETIDFTFSAKNSLTYRYILFTALTAKAVEPAVDIMSLQANDNSEGAYDARSLCSKAIYPFQKMFLSDTIDGSNSDPLVNKPARFPRLSPENAVAGGDPKKVLAMLCSDLPRIETADCARLCLSYLISKLLEQAQVDQERSAEFAEAADLADLREARNLIDELVDQGFGGAAITIVASAIMRSKFPSEHGYEVSAHPVNQAGSSSRQYSDLDVLRNGKPWLGIELKDKPFVDRDVSHATETAAAANAKALLFIGGRESTIDDKGSAYFSEVRNAWMGKGLYVGVASIDAIIDFVFATSDVDARALLNDLLASAEQMKALEAQMWLYKRVGALKKQS